MKKRKKKKQFWMPQLFLLNVDLYNVDVIIAVGLTGKEVYKRIKARRAKPNVLKRTKDACDAWDKSSTSGAADGFMVQIDGLYLIFIKPYKEKFRKTIGILVHELTHATHYILRERRIGLSRNTEEAHTYLVQYLVTAALREMY